jgi:ABC-2 type transport system ATP-binding protein
MSHSVIELRGFHKSFRDKEVLRDVTLDIPAGAVVGLLGTNGSGKSTLIKCLVGLLKSDGGHAKVLGEDPWNLSASAKSRLGYVPQEMRLYPWMRVIDVVHYTAAFYPEWDDAFADKLLDRWDLPRKDRVGPLSTGQTQKLALVLALGHRPDLLVLDEPVASLDPIARREFLLSLMEITADEKHTVLFSTHITSDLERVASHVALLQDGRIRFHEELDVLKDRVKRVRVEADRDLPHSFSVRGAERIDVQGRVAVVATTGVNDELLTELRDTWKARVTVEDLNLEEIFLELHERPVAART